MPRNTYYFQHDYNASRDPKMIDLRAEYGLEGVGLYWMIVEYMAEQGGKIESNERGLKRLSLAINYPLSELTQKVEFLINVAELFTESYGKFYSIRLIRNLELKASKSRAGRKGGKQNGSTSGSKTEAQVEAKRKQKSGFALSNVEEKRREESKKETNKEKISKPESKNSGDGLEMFIQAFNRIRKQYIPSATGIRKPDEKTRRQFKKLRKEGYKGRDFVTAITNAFEDPYHKSESYRHITTEFITRDHKFAKFLNRPTGQKIMSYA